MPRVPNRSRVLDRRRIVIHCYFRCFFHCFSLLFAAGGNAGRRAQGRAAQGEIRRSVQRRHCYFIVFNNAAVRERRAQQQRGQHDVRPQIGHALPLRANMLLGILARFGAVLFTMSNSPVSRWRQCVFLARRAGPSALGNRSGRPRRMRIFLAQLLSVVNNKVSS
jgi:hypothetical protein